MAARRPVGLARLLALAGALLALACGRSEPRGDGTASSNGPSTASPAAAQRAPCPPDGLWHECSVLERLDRAGLAPRKDSIPASEPSLSARGMLIHVGSAELEVFIFSDEAARGAAEAKLPKGEFVEANEPYTMRHERTLIRSANLLAILKSLRDRQRERVADALTAGPPQPPR